MPALRELTVEEGEAGTEMITHRTLGTHNGSKCSHPEEDRTKNWGFSQRREAERLQRKRGVNGSWTQRI